MENALGVVLVALVVFSFIAAVVSILLCPPIDENEDNGSSTRHARETVQHARSRHCD